MGVAELAVIELEDVQAGEWSWSDGTLLQPGDSRQNLIVRSLEHNGHYARNSERESVAMCMARSSIL